MPQKNRAETPTKSTNDTAMAVVASGDAAALGEDTFTAVSMSITIKDKGDVTKGKGKIETIAAAESPDGDAFVLVANDVTASGADLIIIKTKNKIFEGDDESFVISVTKFKLTDIENKDGETKVIEHIKDRTIRDKEFDIDLIGNVSHTEFNVRAYGDNSLVIVDAYSLAHEDGLSTSTIVATAATGWFYS